MDQPYEVITETPPMKSAQPSTIDYLDQPTAARRSGGLAWLRYPVYICSGLVGGFLLARSLNLYQVAFAKWGLGTISNACPQLSATPLIGGLLAGGCGQVAAVIVGLVTITALLTLTILQSLPTALYFHPKAISGMVAQLRLNRKGRTLLSAESGDTEEIRALVDRHNSLSDKQLRSLSIFAIAAFALEAWIILTARAGTASIGAAVVDSLAVDALLGSTLAFATIFRPQATAKIRRYGE